METPTSNHLLTLGGIFAAIVLNLKYLYLRFVLIFYNKSILLS